MQPPRPQPSALAPSPFKPAQPKAALPDEARPAALRLAERLVPAAEAPRGPEVLEIVHAGRTHRVRVKRVGNARRLILRVRAATRDVVLTMPPRSSLPRARQFVERHAEWIGHRLDNLPSPTPFGPGATVPLRGVPHEIRHRPGERRAVWLEAGDAPRLCIGGDSPFVERRIRDYLKAQARADLAVAVARHAAALGVGVRRITLRDTTSRWGSCSSSLVMAPPHVLDYLAAHEVAHLVHMNHSDAFWATVARLMPDYPRAEGWLKLNGLGLMRFGTSSR